LKIVEREINETIYWLKLCPKHDLIQIPSLNIMNLVDE